MEDKVDERQVVEQTADTVKGENLESDQKAQVHQLTAPDPTSKRQAKLKARKELLAEKNAKKKEKKKQKKEEQKQKESESTQEKSNEINTEPADLKKSTQEEEEEKKQENTQQDENKLTSKEKKKLYKEAVEKGQPIIIDCSFQDILTPKELKSVCEQLGYCQGTNKKFPAPTKLTITSFRDKVKERITHAGALQWGVVLLEKHYTEYFKREDLIYLTGDAEEEIEEIDPTKIYILGGLVDHGRMQNATYGQATREGIKAMRLPIGKYLTLGTKTSLSINHVFDVMIRLANGYSMQKALVEVIPAWRVQEYSKQSREVEGNSEKKIVVGDTEAEKIEMKEDSSEKDGIAQKI